MSCVGCTFWWSQSPATDNVPAIIGLDNQTVRQKAGGSRFISVQYKTAPYKVEASSSAPGTAQASELPVPGVL